MYVCILDLHDNTSYNCTISYFILILIEVDNLEKNVTYGYLKFVIIIYIGNLDVDL